MSSDEDGGGKEAFEVTDYDLENEFNPHRKRRRMTKEQAALGIFAGDEDEHASEEEEESGRPSFGNLSMHMKFVSGTMLCRALASSAQRSHAHTPSRTHRRSRHGRRQRLGCRQRGPTGGVGR
jgi:hypothetical protein